MFAGLILILSFFNKESPRFLIKNGDVNGAYENLSRIRTLPQDHECVVREIKEIQEQLAEEEEATMGVGKLGLFKEMFLMPNNFYRIYIVCQALPPIFKRLANIFVSREYFLNSFHSGLAPSQSPSTHPISSPCLVRLGRMRNFSPLVSLALSSSSPLSSVPFSSLMLSAASVPWVSESAFRPCPWAISPAF